MFRDWISKLTCGETCILPEAREARNGDMAALSCERTRYSGKRSYAMGDKGKKDREKGQKQKAKKQGDKAKKKQEKQPKRTP